MASTKQKAIAAALLGGSALGAYYISKGVVGAGKKVLPHTPALYAGHQAKKARVAVEGLHGKADKTNDLLDTLIQDQRDRARSKGPKLKAVQLS